MKNSLFLAGVLSFSSLCLSWGSALNAAEATPETMDMAAVEMETTELVPVTYLRLPLAPLENLNPAAARQAASIEVSTQLFAPLTKLDPKTYQVQPALATHWEVSADGLTYEFKLRPEAVWNNGEPLTAADVVWTLRHYLSPATNLPKAHILYVLKNAQAIHQGQLTDFTQLGVKAVDPYTVLFTLEQPLAYFPVLTSLWMFTPLPAVELDRYGESWGRPGTPLVSSGPYQVQQWQPEQPLILTQNLTYFAVDDVSIPGIQYHWLNDIKSGLYWYERDELDILGGHYLALPKDTLKQLKEANSPLIDNYRTTPSLCTEFYGFNIQQPPLDNSLVRKAIIAAIDRQRLIDEVLTQHQPAQTFVPPPLLGSVPISEEIGIDFNEHKARTWLADAGYPDGEGFPSLILMINEDAQHRKVAEAIQLFLRTYLNINLEIKEYSFADYIAQLYRPEQPIHLFRMGWCGDYPDAHSWLYEAFHTPQTPLLAWQNETFQAAVSRAQIALDPAQREQAYWQAEYLLVEQDAVMIPLYFLTTDYLVKPNIVNWSARIFGGQPVMHWLLIKPPE